MSSDSKGGPGSNQHAKKPKTPRRRSVGADRVKRMAIVTDASSGTAYAIGESMNRRTLIDLAVAGVLTSERIDSLLVKTGETDSGLALQSDPEAMSSVIDDIFDKVEEHDASLDDDETEYVLQIVNRAIGERVAPELYGSLDRRRSDAIDGVSQLIRQGTKVLDRADSEHDVAKVKAHLQRLLDQL